MNGNKMNALVDALIEGNAFTVAEMKKRFKFNSINSTTGVITHLRQEGFNIKLFRQKGRKSRYALAENYKKLKKLGYEVAA